VAISAPKRLREAGSPKPAGRRVRRRLSTTHVLTAIVVILAFVLNLLVLSDRGSTTLVAVADARLPAGSTFDSTLVRLVPIDSSFDGLASLAAGDQISGFEGWILQRSIPEGSVLSEGDLIAPTEGEGSRSMSLPVAREHASGGALVPGDRVDVISVVDGEARFVALDLEVVSVADQSSGSIGATGVYHVVVSVEADEALSLAKALDDGSMELVRSTGASEVEEGAGRDG